MLHNTGLYGPNETPINMGAPLNMSQISTPVMPPNMTKLPPPPSQSSAGSYNLHNFNPYAHPPVNLSPQMGPFPNYHSPFSSNFVGQTPNPLLDTGWQNGMLPMNLNVQSDQTSHTLNYPYEKTPQDHGSSRDLNQFRKTPLNIPQVPTKAYHKHTSINENFNNFGMYNENFRQSPEHLDLSMKAPDLTEQDNTRRKLENTIKLIENILVNTTRNRELALQGSNEDKARAETSEMENEDFAAEDDMDDKESSQGSTELDRDILEENRSISDQDPSDNEDVKPIINDEKVEEMTNVVVKVEKMPYVESESMKIFHSDKNAIFREYLINGRIVDAETSVAEAVEYVKNGTPTDSYFECPHCRILLKHPKRFLIHTKWHTFGLTEDKRIEIAREKLAKKNLKREIKSERLGKKITKDVKISDKILPCKDCDKVFGSKSSLKNHKQRTWSQEDFLKSSCDHGRCKAFETFHPTRARDCKICHKTVYGWMALRAHLASHTSDSGYQCTECPKRFKYSHSLTKHRDTHLEKTHGCEQCPKMFGSQALLKMHMKCHERAQRGATFRCTYCGKGFFESWNLQVHERTHRNERPFQCEICNTSFGTNSSLKRHKRVSHSTSKPHECSTCHRSFVSQIILERHERRAHGDPEDFKFVCELCPCRYLKSKDLQKHMYKAHPKCKRKRRSKSDSE